MPRLSTLSNPTGLIDIDKKRLTLQVDDSGHHPVFSLLRLDTSDLNLAGNLLVVVIARRGNSEQRIELGPLASFSKAFHPLVDLGEDGPLAFRVLLARPDSPKLVAAAEHVRPAGHGESESFIGLEPADLKQLPWEVEVHDQEGRATIRFNRDIYQSAGAAESDRMFMGLVLPEAVRSIARTISATPGMLEDEHWQPFKSWLAVQGITEEPEPDREHEWCTAVVHAFCDRFEFTSQLKESRGKEVEE
jgi:hypothetical protein